MNIPTLQKNEIAQKTMPLLDMEKIQQEDNEDEINGIPPRFGYKHKTNYNLDNSGEWVDSPDGGKIWRLAISCPGALSINLLYDKFWLPLGAKFFIYSNDHRYGIGAFTSANNKGDSKNIQGFATGLIYGNEITLEYYLPKEAKKIGIISVAYVVHGYRFIVISPNHEDAGGYGQSMSCNINVNCPEGQNWQNEKNAVAMILVNGNRVCSGSLINTTANDNRPLFLTANHCLGNQDAISNPQLEHWSFYWHYESPSCTNDVPEIFSTTGATLIANNSISDFALLHLAEDPRDVPGVTPYYLGWDRTENIGTEGVGIHHPKGDIKKISHTNQIVNNSNHIYWADGKISLPNTHWNATFSDGLIEGGSSGSPLINTDKRIVGQLHGGPGAVCNTYYIKRYGKFSVSWTGDGATDNRRKLQTWLDPASTGTTVLDGIETCTSISLHGLQPEPPDTYKNVTCHEITTDATVPAGTKLELNASTSINMNAGFEVQAGAEFEANVTP